VSRPAVSSHQGLSGARLFHVAHAASPVCFITATRAIAAFSPFGAGAFSTRPSNSRVAARIVDSR
jgi:hypothetical protein